MRCWPTCGHGSATPAGPTPRQATRGSRAPTSPTSGRCWPPGPRSSTGAPRNATSTPSTTSGPNGRRAHPLRPPAGTGWAGATADPEPRLAQHVRGVAAAGTAADRSVGAWHRRSRLRRRHPLAARLRLFRAATPNGGDLPLRRRAVAPPHARARLPPLRRPRERLRGRGRHLHGPGRPPADARRAPEHPGDHALHRSRVAAAVAGRAGLPGGDGAVGADRGWLQGDPVDQAADPWVWADRLAGRAGRLDPGEVAGLGGLGRRPHRLPLPRAAAEHADDL